MSIWTDFMGAEVKHYQAGPWKTRAIEAGSGPALVLIHGGGGHAECYAKNVIPLSEHFHVYAIDALYHGFSDKANFDGPEMTIRQADGLADLIKALGYSWAHVEGESMGGEIVWTLGVRHPEMCGKLIMNTGGPWYKPKRTDFVQNPGGGSTLAELSKRSIDEPSFETIRARMEWLVVEPERMTDEMVNIRLRLYSFPEIYESIKRVYASSQPFLDEEALQGFKPESLVFWSEKNPGNGPDFGEHMAELIPGAKFYNMMDAAHWPQWEKPEEHDQVLIDFIKG